MRYRHDVRNDVMNETVTVSFPDRVKSPPPYHVFLNDYFGELKEKNVGYCVLSGYEGLPDAFRSDDIDILVARGSLHEASTILKSVFRKYGSGYFALHKFKGRQTYIFFFQGTDGWISESIKVDIFLHLEFRGRVFLSSREILQEAIPHNDIYIPCAMHQAYIGVVKGVLKGGPAWEKYLPRIQRGLAGHAGGMESLLRRTFREKTAKLLVSDLAAGNTERMETNRKRLIRETYAISFLNRPIRFPMNLLSYLLFRAGNLVNPPNYLIAVLGPDGAGKTTLIERMKVRFQDVFKMDSRGVKVFHIRPGLFPTITELLKKKGHAEEKPSFLREAWHAPSRAISLVRLLCFWADYVLGYFVKILPELGRFHVVILDRYYYDLLIDPSRYKIRLPRRVMKSFFSVLPTPDVAFVLDAPPEVIFQRKRELNEGKIGTLLGEYRNLKSEIDDLHILQATNTPEELSGEVVTTFLKSAARRLG